MRPERAHLLAAIVYVPHLVDEHLAGMWNDPVVVRMFAPLANLAPRQAAYLVFQAMFVLGLVAMVMVSRGRRAGDLVLFGLALGLLGETHHLVRALAESATNPGLFTSLPMPLVGLWLLVHLARANGRATNRASANATLGSQPLAH